MLGDLSARYESNGDVGAISDNELDWGGNPMDAISFLVERERWSDLFSI